MDYLLSLHRYGMQFPPDSVHRALALVQLHLPTFFPARMAAGPDRWVAIPDSTSFEPSSIPAEYWIESGRSVRIPIESLHGPSLEIEDHTVPGPVPSYLGLHLSEEELPETSALVALLAELGQALEADRGRVTDGITLTRRDIRNRARQSDKTLPEALYWMNWFGAKAVAALGRARFDALADVANVEQRDGGLLVLLMNTPLRPGNSDDEARRLVAEERFGLRPLRGGS